MDKVIIYKNKPESFRCHLAVEGASVDDVSIRMLLEFSDNKNLLFYGKIQDDGSCLIKVPKLKDITKATGRLVIEAVADGTHFDLYEADLELKNSVEVKMTSARETVKEEVDGGRPVAFRLERVEEPSRQRKVTITPQPVIQEVEEALIEDASLVIPKRRNTISVPSPSPSPAPIPTPIPALTPRVNFGKQLDELFRQI